MKFKIIFCIGLFVSGLSARGGEDDLSGEVTIRAIPQEPFGVPGLELKSAPSGRGKVIRIAVAGCVKTPGIYYVSPGTDLEAAITQAGGRDGPALLRELIVTNSVIGERMVISFKQPDFTESTLRIGLAARILVREGDVIFIPMIM